MSYNKILEQTKVSKSTLSLWLRDVDLTFEQQKRLLVGREKSRYAAGAKKKYLRILKTNKIMDESRKEVRKLLEDPLFIIGLCLYWAEGAKNSTESVKLANSDPLMIGMAMKWFRNICKVPERKFRIHVHIHNLHCRPEIEKYWSRITGISTRQFYRTYVKKSSLGQRRNILYNGTCSITISNKDLFRKIMGWKLGLQEYFNISP